MSCYVRIFKKDFLRIDSWENSRSPDDCDTCDLGLSGQSARQEDNMGRAGTGQNSISDTGKLILLALATPIVHRYIENSTS